MINWAFLYISEYTELSKIVDVYWWDFQENINRWNIEVRFLLKFYYLIIFLNLDYKASFSKLLMVPTDFCWRGRGSAHMKGKSVSEHFVVTDCLLKMPAFFLAGRHIASHSNSTENTTASVFARILGLPKSVLQLTCNYFYGKTGI